MVNPIKNKSLAEQKRIAEVQRQAQLDRERNLARSVEAKKHSAKTQTELFKEKQLRDAQKQSELVKLAYYNQEQENTQT